MQDFLKAQYMLKQNFYYFLITKTHLFLLIVCFFVLEGSNFFLTYPILTLLSYRFLFRKTKLDNPYKIGFLEKISKGLKFLRRNA